MKPMSNLTAREELRLFGRLCDETIEVLIELEESEIDTPYFDTDYVSANENFVEALDEVLKKHRGFLNKYKAAKELVEDLESMMQRLQDSDDWRTRGLREYANAIDRVKDE